MTVGSKPNEFNHISSHEVFQSFNDTDILNILAIDQHGTVVYANKAELALSGYIYDEYIGKPLKQFYSSESALQKIFKSIADSQELYNIESVLELKDGTCRNVLISTRNLQDDTGTGYTYLFVRDISTYKKNENLLSYLNTSTEALAGARDSKDALNKIADLIVPKFANWFTIDVLKGGKLELLKLAHKNPEYVKIAADYLKKYPIDLNSDSGTALVLRTGRPSFVPVVTSEMIEAGISDPDRRKILQSLELHSVIAVAMFSKEVITGVVTFISSTPGKYDEADLRFAQNFANHIGLALENTRLNEEAISEIEQRRKIEDELRRTQIQLKTALSSGLIGTWIRDFENDVTYVDESFCKIYGLEYSPNGIDPAVLINHIHPEDRVVAEFKRDQNINKRKDYENEYRIISSEGIVKWVFLRGKTEVNKEGKIIRVTGVIGDITERKNTEHALKESEERFRLMAESMPQKIFVTDENAGLLYLNPQWEEFTGHTMEEINELTLAHFIHPEDLEENLKRWKEAVKTGREFKYEHRFRAKDGVYYWHLTRALALTDANGKNLWIGSITDIDEQKKNEHKKDEFISIASHELKTPITSLRGYLQIMSKIAEKESLSSIAPVISKTHRQAHKLSALISDLLDVSKMQAGKMNYNFSEFNFSEIVDDAIADAQNNYSSHKITKEGNINTLVYGDKHRLEQVLLTF